MVRETSFCMRGSEYEIHNGSECRENLTVQCSALHTDITLSKAEETLRRGFRKNGRVFMGRDAMRCSLPDTAVTLMHSQLLWLPVGDLHKTRPANIPQKMRERLTRPHPSLRRCGQVNGVCWKGGHIVPRCNHR